VGGGEGQKERERERGKREEKEEEEKIGDRKHLRSTLTNGLCQRLYSPDKGTCDWLMGRGSPLATQICHSTRS